MTDYEEELEGLAYPDVGGPIKPTLDALEGILFEDDTQIQQLHVRKRYEPEVPRIDVEVVRAIPEDHPGFSNEGGGEQQQGYGE